MMSNSKAFSFNAKFQTIYGAPKRACARARFNNIHIIIYIYTYHKGCFINVAPVDSFATKHPVVFSF
jgi:hypothetical protein